MDELTVRASLAAALLLPCILCGKPAVGAGVFVPDDPQASGAPPGKTRGLFYSLCAHCQDEPRRNELVEDVLGKGRR
jgi:hypothetical protein